ncbi:MAG: hypothetical protein KF795_23360 [Labilithrix sp.]|nr:hypothetical protein [Labilithrix sp.]
MIVRAASLLFVFGISSLAACSIAEIPGGGGAAPGDPQTTTAATCSDPASPDTLEELDPAAVTPCECKAGGKARCVAKSKIPASLSKQLADCDGAGGACVPETILASRAEPPSCKTSGAEGRCVSLCVPKVAKYAEALTQGDGDTCATDERCVPCTMPDGAPSGVCDIGKPSPSTCASAGDGGTGAPAPPGAISCPFTGTEMDVSRMPVCAPGGRCVTEGFLDDAVTDPKTRAELRARLATCATGFCVPEEYLKKYGQHKPMACSSFAGIEGRCFSTVFKDVAAQKDLLQRDVCGADDRCIPCFNPADGTPTGACTTVTCDAATKTPPVLRDCCRKRGQMRGKCVPARDVPSQFQSRLSEEECDGDTELCVPSKNLDLKNVPDTCTPKSGGAGVCVSECIEFGLLEGLLLSQGGCPTAETCVPCIHPTTKQPTGAPGCK